MSQVSIDSTLLAAIVSAVVAFIVLALDRFLIEPRKWRVRYEISAIERRLALYNWLLSILNACQEKAKRQQEQGESAVPHLLETSDILQLEDIFGRKAYLLSDTACRKIQA